MTDKLKERPFHELNQIAQYAEHIRWIVDTYSLPKKAEEKLRLTADVLSAESETFDALEQQVTTLQKKANFLEALRIAGVDNWQGYSHAYEVAKEYGLDIGDD